MGYKVNSSGLYPLLLGIPPDPVFEQTFPIPAQLYAHYPSVCLVYSSGIHPVGFGDGYESILCATPLKPKQKGNYIFFETSIIEYIKTSTQFLSQLAINLRTLSGELIEFDNNDKAVTLQLSLLQ
jgi:hypothetical protein